MAQLPRGAILLAGALLLVGAVALSEAAQCGFFYQTAFPGCADCDTVNVTKNNKTFTKTNCTACNVGYLPTAVTEGGKKIAICAACDLAGGVGYSFKAFPVRCEKCTNNTVPLTLRSNLKIVKINGTCTLRLRDPALQPPPPVNVTADDDSAAVTPATGNITIPPSCKQFAFGACTPCVPGSTTDNATVTCYNATTHAPTGGRR